MAYYSPIQFVVQTCRPVHFEISGFGGSSSFSKPLDQRIVTVGPPVPPPRSVQADIYVQFVSPSPAVGLVTGTVIIRAYFVEQGYYSANHGDQFTLGTYTINLIANSIVVGVIKVTAVPPGRELHRGMTVRIPEVQLESPEDSKIRHQLESLSIAKFRYGVTNPPLLSAPLSRAPFLRLYQL